MKSVEDLDVFKLAHSERSELTRRPRPFPSGETFSLVEQMWQA